MHKIIGLELTSACNLRCKMCPCVDSFTGEKLPDNIIEQVFNDISRYNSEVDRNKKGIHTIRFDGNNEPLLNQNIPDLISLALEKNKGIHTYLVTNGLLLNNLMSDRLLKSGLDKLHVSITGNTKEVYKHFQGYGLPDEIAEKNFDFVNLNAKYFIDKSRELALSPEIVLSFIVNEDSYKDVPGYALKWLNNGASLDIRGLGSYVKNNSNLGNEKEISGVIRYKPCIVVGHMLLKANGDLLLSCCERGVPVLGNVFKNDLYSILTSPEFLTLEAAFDNLTVEAIPKICLNCANMHVYKSDGQAEINEQYGTEKDENINNFNNSDFKNNNLKEFFRQIKGRELVLFGAGNGFYEAKRIAGNIPIKYIIDNDKNKHGSELNGIKVYPVEHIINEDLDNIVILVSTLQIYSSIIRQLQQLGISRYFILNLFPEKYGCF